MSRALREADLHLRALHGLMGHGLIAACLMAVPAIAHADVLEVGANGFGWVAGGPASAAPAPSAPAEPYVTHAQASAGPDLWRARVAELAARYDLSPSLIEAVVWQESRWHAAAVSPAGAKGLAQLMPGTARHLGVDAADPAANLEGGARYLRQMLDRFGGDVEKALAAYNAGPGRVEKAGGIPAIPETRTYVGAIMARLSEPVRR